MRVHQTALLHHINDGVDEVKALSKDLLEEVRAIAEGRLAPDDTQLSNVNVGES